MIKIDFPVDNTLFCLTGEDKYQKFNILDNLFDYNRNKDYDWSFEGGFTVYVPAE
jgi:hypothetical protein